jgi:GDP-D-mannose dehydratase
MKKVFITGITGQDGSYLAELLLSKGYEVHGLIRRASTFNLERLYNINQNEKLILHFGDMSESARLLQLISDIHPDEIYNLAAQSHVRISFDSPEYTSDITGIGALRILEAIRKVKFAPRFYQASSSEMYGTISPPQSEHTPFEPNSPYACAKLFAYNTTRNYRRAFNLFASSGILFNHSLHPSMPLFFHINNLEIIDILPIRDIVELISPCRQNNNNPQHHTVDRNVSVWDGNDWSRIKGISMHYDMDKKVKIVNARGSVYSVSDDHICYMDDNREKKAGEIIWHRTNLNNRCKDMNIDMGAGVGDKLLLGKYPVLYEKELGVSENEAMLCGFIVACGSINENETITLCNSDMRMLEKYRQIIPTIYNNYFQMGEVKEKHIKEKTKKYLTISPMDDFWKKFQRKDFYTTEGYKRIPWKILNSNSKIKLAFIHGYYESAGLQKGHSLSYEFKNVKSGSAVLIAGLVCLIYNLMKQEYNINIDIGAGISYYYSVNFLSNSNTGQNARTATERYTKVKLMLDQQCSQRETARKTGITRTFIRKVKNGYIPKGRHHFQQDRSEVKKVIDMVKHDGWFYDIETNSGKFMCGVGLGIVHNSSPRRGLNFVTKKVTSSAARIKMGLQDDVYLGNLKSRRDFGYAGDYVEAMWLMLQHDTPDDFVIASGEFHTIQELVELAYGYAGLDWQKYVRIDPKLFRPSEVDNLLGDPSKAKNVLGWKPKLDFAGLIRMMYDYDLIEAEKEVLLKNSGYEINHKIGGE